MQVYRHMKFDAAPAHFMEPGRPFGDHASWWKWSALPMGPLHTQALTKECLLFTATNQGFDTDTDLIRYPMHQCRGPTLASIWGCLHLDGGEHGYGQHFFPLRLVVQPVVGYGVPARNDRVGWGWVGWDKVG